MNIEAYTSFTKYKIIILWQISLQITFLSDKVKLHYMSLFSVLMRPAPQSRHLRLS